MGALMSHTGPHVGSSSCWERGPGQGGWQLGTESSPFCSQQKTELPVTENVQTIPPPYVVRTILLYSRPPCQPQFSLTEPMKVSLEGREGGHWLDIEGDRSGSQRLGESSLIHLSSTAEDVPMSLLLL